MNIKVKAPRVNTFVDLGLLLFVLKTGFDVSGILPHNTIVDNIIIVVGLGTFVISVLQQNYSANTLFKYAIVTVLSLCSTLTSGQSVIIITVITILAIRQLDFTKVIRKIRIWSTWFICIHSICFLIQLLLGNAKMFSTDAQGRVRASFGFGHAHVALSAPIISAYCVASVLWSRIFLKEKLSWKHVAMIFLIETAAFMLTNSRTSYLCVIVFLLLLVLILYSKSSLRWLNKVAGLIFPILSVLALVSYKLLLDGNMTIRLIDDALTGRITLVAYAFQKDGLSFIGQKMSFGKIAWTPEWQLNYFTLDCTYTSLWVNIGWMWIIILMVCFLMLAKRKEIKISLFIIMWALYAISEVQGLDAYLCFPILMVVLLLNNQIGFDDNKTEG